MDSEICHVKNSKTLERWLRVRQITINKSDFHIPIVTLFSACLFPTLLFRSLSTHTRAQNNSTLLFVRPSRSLFKFLAVFSFHVCLYPLNEDGEAWSSVSFVFALYQYPHPLPSPLRVCICMYDVRVYVIKGWATTARENTPTNSRVHPIASTRWYIHRRNCLCSLRPFLFVHCVCLQSLIVSTYWLLSLSASFFVPSSFWLKQNQRNSFSNIVWRYRETDFRRLLRGHHDRNPSLSFSPRQSYYFCSIVSSRSVLVLNSIWSTIYVSAIIVQSGRQAAHRLAVFSTHRHARVPSLRSYSKRFDCASWIARLCSSFLLELRIHERSIADTTWVNALVMTTYFIVYFLSRNVIIAPQECNWEECVEAQTRLVFVSFVPPLRSVDVTTDFRTHESLTGVLQVVWRRTRHSILSNDREIG